MCLYEAHGINNLNNSQSCCGCMRCPFLLWGTGDDIAGTILPDLELQEALAQIVPN